MLCRLKGRLGDYKMNKFILLNDDDWFDKYKPMANHIDPDNDLHFETYGKEFDYACLMDRERRVWTCVDDDDGQPVTVNGMAFVNRIHYYVCEVPYDPDTDYVVVDPD